MHVLILRLCGKAVKLVFGVFKAEQKMCDTIVMLVMLITQPWRSQWLVTGCESRRRVLLFC